jgi:ABC-type bacteriocin/lantibiotic exporter with double-glycine peptidase domain
MKLYPSVKPLNLHNLGIFFSYIFPYRYKEAALLLLMIAGNALSLASPYALKIIIDDVIPSKNYGYLLIILSALTFIYIVRFSFSFISDYLNTWLSNRIVNDLKMQLFSNLMEMSYSYFEKNKSGEVIQIAHNEVHKIQHFLTNSIIRLLNSTFSLIGLGTMLCILDYKLFLISILIFPISVIINKYFNKKIRSFIEESSKKEGDIYSFYIDRIKNIKLLKSFNASDREKKSLSSKLHAAFNIYLKISTLSSFSKNGSSFFVALGPLIVLAIGGYQVMEGLLTVGALVAFIQYLNRIYAPANDVIFLYVDYVRAKVSMNRIEPLLRPEHKVESSDLPKGKIKQDETIQEITFKDIGFSYGSTRIIDGFNISLVRGKKYAFVGLSGSGKSTLVKLLSKFDQPEKGEIIINGDHLLNRIDTNSWMQKISIIHQEPLVLTETVRENLLYGKFSASEKELWKALQAVNLDVVFRQLPMQLDTQIGGGIDSTNLSGGQQQQIAIARALLKKSDVLILDEAASALDSIKEREILKNLSLQYSNKIIVSISHRLSSIIDFDQIIVLEKGRVKEMGNHKDLIKMKGSYYNLFKDQLQEELSQTSTPGDFFPVRV